VWQSSHSQSDHHVAQAPELHAFAVADESSYFLFVVNEDEAAPAETRVNLELWDDVPGGSTIIACLVAEGCAARPTPTRIARRPNGILAPKTSS